ncbi:MAG: helical backbone metal receptor [Planctomycetota bacterium]
MRIVVLALLLPTSLSLLCACERSDSATPPTATSPVNSAKQQPVELCNWVLEPVVAASEQNVAIPRLVCAAPSATEICCALGLRTGIIGRTRFCDYPPGITTIPAIGALDETNVEFLLNLVPDLILVSGTSRAITERLTRLDLPLASLPDRGLPDIFTAIEQVGELTNRPASATQLSACLRAELDEITAAYCHVAPARVLVITGTLANPPTPPFAAGPDSFYHDLLRRAGHQNVLTDGASAYGPLSLEFIARADPDVIIELDADGRARPGGDTDAVQAWSRIGKMRAVATNRIHVLKGQAHFIPGPRITYTYRAMCQAIAGERHD